MADYIHTHPYAAEGSMWALNPLPESPTKDFPPPCKGGATTPRVRAPMALGKYGYNPGSCAGNFIRNARIKIVGKSEACMGCR